MTMTETTTTEVAHDLVLADLMNKSSEAAYRLSNARAKAKYSHNPERAEADVAAAQDAYMVTVHAIADHEDAYTGWSRFYLVTNSGGHIHRSTGCSTCFPSTQFAFLPEMSGQTDEIVVEAEGEILCSICYPDAPVAWTNGTSKRTEAEKAAKAAERATKAEAKRAKQLFEDGTELRVGHDRVGTIAAAKSWLTDSAEWNPEVRTDRHPSFSVEDTLTVAAALADRTGDTVENVIAAAVKRAGKRR